MADDKSAVKNNDGRELKMPTQTRRPKLHLMSNPNNDIVRSEKAVFPSQVDCDENSSFTRNEAIGSLEDDFTEEEGSVFTGRSMHTSKEAVDNETTTFYNKFGKKALEALIGINGCNENVAESESREEKEDARFVEEETSFSSTLPTIPSANFAYVQGVQMVQQPQQQQKKNDYELMPALFAASDEETAGCGNAMKIVHDNTVIPPVSINHCNKNELLSKRLENRCSSIFSERGGHTLDVEKVFLSTKPKQNGKNKPQTILKGISSSFTPNTVTAIMGPSGSGKTSLLKILTGRLSQKSKLSLNGTIKLDGEVVDPTSINIRKQIAYVEQDVSILPTSTPREAIKFSARLRLDKSVSDKEIDDLVSGILENLGLTHVADNLVGGGLVRGGLSGGEKKRLQCGIELVTNPEIIVLDEPTSGLDSFSALSLMNILQKIAKAGATVIVTIHQPSPPVVRKIDKVLLLLSGRVLYDGPITCNVEEFFEQKGFPKPNDYNIADWVLEVAQTTPLEELEKVGFFNEEAMHPKIYNVTLNYEIDVPENANVNHPVRKFTEQVGYRVQTRLLFNRELKKLLRDKISFVINVGSGAFFGILFGCIFFQVGQSDYLLYPEVTATFGALSNLLISSMFGSVQSSLTTFPTDRPIFLREYSTNHYSIIPYFLSKFSMECFTIFVQVFSQLLAAYFLMGFKASFFALMGLISLLSLASTSIGIFIGCMNESPDAALQLMPMLLVPQLLFSGFFIQVNLIPAFLRWAQYLCSLTYASRLATLFEFSDCDTQSCHDLLLNNNVNQMTVGQYWILLGVIASSFRIASLLLLRRRASF